MLRLSKKTLDREWFRSDYKLNEYPKYKFYLDIKKQCYVVIDLDDIEKDRYAVVLRCLPGGTLITHRLRRDIANKIVELIDIKSLMR